MLMRVRRLVKAGAAAVLAGAVLCGGAVATAQGKSAKDKDAKDDGVNLELHANGHATAAEIGLPVYPGATLYKAKSEDSDSADLGFTLGNFHLSVIAVSYVTGDSQAEVLKFYRKRLARYGEVLQCDHGKPVGKLTVTNTGLTCSDDHGGHVQVNGSGNSGDDVELRAGSPHKYRLVGIDSSQAGKTKFGLVYLELPNNKSGQAE
jgi:hypothetical protein